MHLRQKKSVRSISLRQASRITFYNDVSLFTVANIIYMYIHYTYIIRRCIKVVARRSIILFSLVDLRARKPSPSGSSRAYFAREGNITHPRQKTWCIKVECAQASRKRIWLWLLSFFFKLSWYTDFLLFLISTFFF